MIIKGLSIAIICIGIGIFAGHKLTWMHLEKAIKLYEIGVAEGKQTIQKK